MWINGGDIILVGLRDYQDGKADVILKYSPDEARNLKAYGELPESGKMLSALCWLVKLSYYQIPMCFFEVEQSDYTSGHTVIYIHTYIYKFVTRTESLNRQNRRRGQ